MSTRSFMNSCNRFKIPDIIHFYLNVILFIFYLTISFKYYIIYDIVRVGLQITTWFLTFESDCIFYDIVSQIAN